MINFKIVIAWGSCSCCQGSTLPSKSLLHGNDAPNTLGPIETFWGLSEKEEIETTEKDREQNDHFAAPWPLECDAW
jgi:hypothetical protein